MSRPDLTQYGSAIAELLEEERIAELGPGKPNEGVRKRLATLQLQDLFPGKSIHSESMGRACLAGLWLYHDFLDESHHLSQEISSPTGSYWHAFMHRREPDAWNSKYWFRRVGSHPVLTSLAVESPSLGYNFTDPFAFVDFVERVRGTGSADEELAKQVQLLEWQLLFDHCYRHAIGG